MKNKPFLLLLLLLAGFQVQAQNSGFRLGIRFAPNLATNRVTDMVDTDNLDFETNRSGLRFSAGLTGDFYFGKNYSFYTGLWYTTYRLGLKMNGTGLQAGRSASCIYNMQHVQVPIALKLFTNEIATDMKLYFVLGGTAGIKISEKEKEWEATSDRRLPELSMEKPTKGKAASFADVGLLLGMGVEYQLGENTSLFGGLSYNRGLLNVASKKGPIYVNQRDSDNFYKISTNLISLEVGLKF